MKRFNNMSNQHMTIKKFARAAFAAVAILGWTCQAETASVNWQTPTTLTGDTDVSTDGTLVYAYTENGMSATVNGVTFDAGNSTTSLGSGNVTLTGFDSTAPSTFNVGHFSGEYAKLIDGSPWSYGSGSGTVTLSNLTAGNNYQVQIWVADYRYYGRFTETLDGQAALQFGNGLGQTVIGTFTSDGSGSQLINFASGSKQINAIQVRDVTAICSLVAYNGNGATGGSVPVDADNPYANGATVTVFGNTGGLMKAGGYVFTNWNTVANGSGTAYNPGDSFTIAVNTTLYAQFVFVPVTWGTATDLTGDSDVETNGVLVYAYTQSGVSATCNGVTFEAGHSTTSLGNGNVTLSGFVDVVNTFNNGRFSGDYYYLIDGGAYGGTAPGTVTLNNLTSGHQYLVQIWVVDYRSYPNNRTEVLDGQTTLHYMNGGSGQYANGTFTASGTSQLINLAPNESAQINAIQVRDMTIMMTYNSNGITDGNIPVDSNSPYTYGATVTVLGNTGSLVKAYLHVCQLEHGGQRQRHGVQSRRHLYHHRQHDVVCPVGRREDLLDCPHQRHGGPSGWRRLCQ